MIGFGNPDRADDGFGIAVAERLRDDFPDRVFTEQDGIERVVHVLQRRRDIEMVVFIDTVDACGEGGQLMVLADDDLEERTVSVHRMPIKLYGALLEKPYYVVGIQPVNLAFGETISGEVQQRIEEVVAALSKSLQK